jgi:TPR repeat protein
MNPDLAMCYEILGLPESAPLHEVKKARRRFAKKWHPDLFHGVSKIQRQNEEKLKQINSAADILVSYLSNNHVHVSATQTDETAKRQEQEARRARAADEAKAREEARAQAEADAKRKAERKRKAEEKERTKQNRKVFSKFHRLAKRGIAEAQYRVAMMHKDGWGCVRNKAGAFRWFKKAAANGDPRSALYLGFAYAWGIDVPVDVLKAIKLYEAAAEKGLSDALFHLGFMHYFGIGVKQDFELAVKCYRKAIDQGYKVSEDHADTCGHYRKETPKEYFKHYKWYALTAQRVKFDD